MRNHLQNRVRAGLLRVAAVLTAAVLTLGSAIPASAATTNKETGTLTILPKIGDTVLDAADYDGTFTVYRVADYNTTGVYTNAEGFESYSEYSINGTTLSDAATNQALALSLANYIEEHQSSITPALSAVKAGVQNTVPYGVYLIMQETQGSYTACTPFLIMIPTYGENKTITDVTAYPKVDKPTTPPGDDNPPGDTPHTPARHGKVALGKSDAETGLPLQGVVFNLYREIDGEWVLVGTYTTDENGVIYVDNLPYGNYQFVEAQPLDGYIADTTPQAFVIDSEDLVKLVMTNTPIPKVPTVPEETHGFTGDDSNMMLYGLIAVFAAAALIGWVVYRRKQNKN